MAGHLTPVVGYTSEIVIEFMNRHELDYVYSKLSEMAENYIGISSMQHTQITAFVRTGYIGALVSSKIFDMHFINDCIFTCRWFEALICPGEGAVDDADGVLVVLEADRVFDAPLSYGTAATWYGVVAFAIQIYCDFSGYSDVAIGTARMLGFDLPSNFDHPCLADSPSNFWRRWHISLSTWLRDYLYIPLGGNRRGTARTYANLAATMLLGGLWHGAAWTFVAWGAYQGALLCAGRAGRWESPPGPLKRPLVGLLARLAAMWVLVLIGWVFFRARTFADAGRLLAHMAGFGRPAVEAWVPTAGLWLIGLFGLTQLAAFARERYGVEPAAHPFVKAAVLTGCVVGILAFSRPVSTAFIYFQF